MGLVFFKCVMGLYDLDLSNYLVTADSSNKDNLRYANYLFKIRYARTNVLNFFRVAKSWNSLSLHLIYR